VTRISQLRDSAAGDIKRRTGEDRRGWIGHGEGPGADQRLMYAASAAKLVQVMRLAGARSRADEDETQRDVMVALCDFGKKTTR